MWSAPRTESIPNAAYHFAVGDVARWTGIKRAGNAMIMGQYAASNILKLLHWQQKQSGTLTAAPDLSSTTDLLSCPDFEPMMALAIGDEAVAYIKASGVVWGKHIEDQIIGRGLGIDSKPIIENRDKDCADLYRMFRICQVRFQGGRSASLPWR